MFNKISRLVCASALSLSAFTTTAQADPRTITVRNDEEVPVRMLIDPAYHYCYTFYSREGPPGQVAVIQPGDGYSWEFDRGSCDGKDGIFKVVLTQVRVAGETVERGRIYRPLAQASGESNSKVCFEFDGALGLWKGFCPNQYNAALRETSSGRFELATLGMTRAYTMPDEGEARWEVICSEICDQESISEKSKESSETSFHQEEEEWDVRAKIEKKFSFAKFEVEGGYRKQYVDQITQSISSGERFTDHRKYVFSREDMATYNVQTIWQFVVPVVVNGALTVVRTNYYACTSNARPPTYIPTDPKAIARSCSGGLNG